uniref:Uncharacterized protein n=1 Tax=Arundo donax TaxID=35708 RepID=A0A0A9FIZ3_ARUDO
MGSVVLNLIINRGEWTMNLRCSLIHLCTTNSHEQAAPLFPTSQTT